MSNAPLLFVHVPKTAGTSFITAMENYFGPGSLEYDYGANSPKTSPLVQGYAYRQPNLGALHQSVLQGSTKAFCGHFPVEKYVQEFGPQNTMVFLREPIQRLVSEFLHSTRQHGYKKDFSDYYRDEYYINRQSNFAGGIPIEDFGFVGITEHYLDSIALANLHFDLDLQVLQVGMHRPKVDSHYSLSSEVTQEIRTLHAKDFCLYEAGLEIFRARLKSIK